MVEEKNKDIDEKVYLNAKLKLEQLQNMKKWIFPIFIGLGIISAIMYLYIQESMLWSESLKTFDYIIAVGFAVFVILVGIAYYNIISDFKRIKYQRIINEKELDKITENIKDDIYENSIKMSYKYLDQYYLQTREQAQKGFFITMSVSVAGAIILAVGIVSMYIGISRPAYITTASGIITEFISAIFFYLYNKTVRSMSSYHNKLVLSQNVSIALKLSESLGNDIKDHTKQEIIKELIKDINNYINSDK